MKAFDSYINPSLAVDMVIFGYHDGRLSVLLLNRREAPFQGQWTLPGAFLGISETFEHACTRVLQTKLGLARLYLEQLYTFDSIGRDPRGRVVATAYFALVNPTQFEIVAGSMANDVQWHGVGELPALGFDHDEIFRVAYERLQAKIVYHPVGFELLDELFTMSELHQLYECILGKEIDRRNFSRKILDAGYILNSGKKREGVRNRNPELFHFNKELQQNNFQLNISI